MSIRGHARRSLISQTGDERFSGSVPPEMALPQIHRYARIVRAIQNPLAIRRDHALVDLLAFRDNETLGGITAVGGQPE